MPSPVSRPAVKRHDRSGDENTPIRVKRRRSLAGTQVTTMEQDPESPRTVSPLTGLEHQSSDIPDLILMNEANRSVGNVAYYVFLAG